MPSTTAQKENSIRVGNGVLKIDGVNIGLLRNAVLSVDYSVLQIRAHNGYLPPKKKPNAVEFKAELYEIDVDNLVTVDGAGAKTAVAGSSVSVTDEAHGTGWTQGQPIRLNNKDADNSSVQSIVVKGGGSTLTLNTDYRVFVGDGTNGELGYTFIVPVTAQAGAITVSYAYVPYASSTYTISDVLALCNELEVVFENTDANGKVFKITIPKGYSAGNLEFAFQSDDTVDDVMTIPVSFKALPDDSNRMVMIYDEQNP